MSDSKERVVINALMRQALIAVEEVIGTNGLHAVLRTSGLEQYIDTLPPNNLKAEVKVVDYAGLNGAIDDFYGRGGSAILRRIGKASFQYGVREQAAILGFTGMAIKLLPKKQRIRVVLSSLASALQRKNPQERIEVEVAEREVAFVIHTCPVCYGRKSDKPICYLTLGSISEAAQWATGDAYKVKETNCIAQGDAYCRFAVLDID